MKLSIGLGFLGACVGLVGLYLWAETNITITPDVVMVKIGPLVLFTYVDNNQLIGYYLHRSDTQQFEGKAYNPHTKKVSTLKHV